MQTSNPYVFGKIPKYLESSTSTYLTDWRRNKKKIRNYFQLNGSSDKSSKSVQCSKAVLRGNFIELLPILGKMIGLLISDLGLSK